MTMLAFRRVLLGKKETNYNEDPSPVPASNAIDARNISFTEDGDLLERDVVRGDLSKAAPVLGKRWGELKFEVDLKGSGTKGVAPQIGAMIQACGFAESASIGSSVVYSPVSVSTASMTFYLYDLTDTNAILRKLTGARGDFKITCEAGQIAKIEFTFKGVYNDPSDVTNPTGMAYETTKPPIVESSQFSFGGDTSLVTRQIDFAMNNDLSDQDDISSASGLKGFIISNRKPSGTFTPEAVLVASEAFNAKWKAATEVAMSLVVGTTDGNKVLIEAPKVTIDKLGENVQNSIIYKNIPFRLNRNAGNDEICIKFQ